MKMPRKRQPQLRRLLLQLRSSPQLLQQRKLSSLKRLKAPLMKLRLLIMLMPKLYIKLLLFIQLKLNQRPKKLLPSQRQKKLLLQKLQLKRKPLLQLQPRRLSQPRKHQKPRKPPLQLPQKRKLLPSQRKLMMIPKPQLLLRLLLRLELQNQTLKKLKLLFQKRRLLLQKRKPLHQLKNLMMIKNQKI